MNFVIYDLTLLVVFAIAISIFLYSRRNNLKKEGLLLLYKSDWGIKLIERIGKKYPRTIKILSYLSIILGYLLMITMVYLFVKIVMVYVFNPEIVRAIKIPPIMPLIPYLPSIFKLNFLPPFYFIYWVIIIAIIAIPHELAHGICAAYNKIKIKNTGFGFFPFFLPVFLAAFVEPDEKGMNKKDKFSQMAILSSGTFANVVTAVFFLFILWAFFSLFFSPIGVVFDTYSYSIINISDISKINNLSVINSSYDGVLDLMDNTNINIIEANNIKYIGIKTILEESANKELFKKQGKMVLYDYSPAIKNGIIGAITKINNVKIDSKEKLAKELSFKKPGEEIEIQTFDGETYNSQKIILEENPEKEGMAWLGIGFIEQERQGIMGNIMNAMSRFKEPNVYYQGKFAFSDFIYNLLWWIILVSISVALINMLPIGIFDGGRFFFLTMTAVTGSEKIAKKTFSTLTLIFLLLLVLMMFFWAFSFW
ncbi:MAG TPA: site-2 protease family protein [Candidatus Nanoarchaeia archaeon]|nr:site-2 protease family protein [Candidatus Nanoarchaeia archaeon]